jgi:hypothetical protein
MQSTITLGENLHLLLTMPMVDRLARGPTAKVDSAGSIRALAAIFLLKPYSLQGIF